MEEGSDSEEGAAIEEEEEGNNTGTESDEGVGGEGISTSADHFIESEEGVIGDEGGEGGDAQGDSSGAANAFLHLMSAAARRPAPTRRSEASGEATATLFDGFFDEPGGV